MNLAKTDWYLILLLLAAFVLVGANELGFGVIVFLPLMLPAYWLMTKAFETETWLTPKLRKGGNEGESQARVWKEQGVSDKVELRCLGSTFQFCGNSG